jgi:aconitate hydratase
VGELPEGATATDLVLTVTQRLREHGVVGKFVEFYGPGVANVALANRATIGNMSPEYGSTITIFPIDAETLRYLEFSGRPASLIALVEAYAKEQGLWHDESSPEPAFSETLELDLSTVEPSLAGPKRPQDRVPLRESKAMFRAALTESLPSVEPASVEHASAESFPASDPVASAEGMEGKGEPDPTATSESTPRAADRPRAKVPVKLTSFGGGETVELDHGHVVIAAITSCTNTSNPYVMLAAGLLAKKAVERGLEVKPWVKTSLAPGSKVVMDYYDRAGLTPYLDKLRFNLVGYGCTTCIGNSGPLPPEISEAVEQGGLAVAAVLSGNRNFEGRINPDVRMNYLASPPLVVAYALAGTMDIDLATEPLGTGASGEAVYLRDIWPTTAEVNAAVAESVESEMFRKSYGEVFLGDERWQGVAAPTGSLYSWAESTYVRKPPYFEGMSLTPAPMRDVVGARVLAKLGDSVTTDHISPAGSIRKDGPAARWLMDHSVEPGDFNSYGARRGNHEVMIRGTFANIRLRNQLAPGTEGGVSVHLPSGEQGSIYEVASRYEKDGVPLVILAGKEYGSGSSRDWAAKGTALLGVRAVLAESYERIHRSNLIGMGVLPLQFLPGDSVASLGLTGSEVFDVTGLEGLPEGAAMPPRLTVRVDGEGGSGRSFEVLLRIDTPKEADYYRHGGILPYVLRQLRQQA